MDEQQVAAAVAVSGSTQVAGVIGWPIAHSLSPVIHNAAYRAMGMDRIYVPFPVEPGRVATALDGFRAAGVVGVNVTMPHKTEAARAMDRLSDEARLLDAVNTVAFTPEGMVGYNTDAPGFDRFLRLDAGFDARGRSVLMYGAGGAARACALALTDAGADQLTVALRDTNKGASIEPILEGSQTRLQVIGMEEVQDVHADLVINATPVGSDLHGAETTTLPYPHLDESVLVVELLYTPAITAFEVEARKRGAAVFGGLGLLLNQAALSFEIWTGRFPPLEIMSAAALSSLGPTGAAGSTR